MNAIKKMILTWLWKIGYKAGLSVASLGDNIFSDAVMQGIKTHIENETSFSTESLATTLGNLDETWAANLLDAADGSVMWEDMGAQNMMEIFSGMFADTDAEGRTGDSSDSFKAAQALFDSREDLWIITPGAESRSYATPDGKNRFSVSYIDGSIVPEIGE